MIHRIGHITILVKDIDRAAAFYVETLGFVKRQDTTFGPGTRWVTVSPHDQPETQLTLVKVHGAATNKALGKQAGNHVLLTLETDDCQRDYKMLKAKRVKFYGKPKTQPYGTEVVFADLYGNLFDLIQRAQLPAESTR